jgi:GNAT superfamily N-acetyltransferase
MPDHPAIKIRPVSVEQIVDLRHRILRSGLPKETAIFMGDNHPGAIHLAAFLSETLIGCATLHRKSPQSYQLRGMAVEPGHQRAGIGSNLLAEAERLAAENKADIIWANCRTPAVPFYKKHGWEIISDEFVVETAGPHFRMQKKISHRGHRELREKD